MPDAIAWREREVPVRKSFIVAAVAIVLGAAGFFWLGHSRSALDAEARAYIGDALTAISAHWSMDELVKRATPELAERIDANSQELTDLFHGASAGLGPLRQYEGAEGEVYLGAAIAMRTAISAKYTAEGQFEKGEATFRVKLLKINGNWRIHGFFIDSADMIANLTKRK
jgi:hypothetical protein